MSDTMLFGVLRMPYEMAMENDMSRRQFYDRAQEAADRLQAAGSAAPSARRAPAPDELPPLPGIVGRAMKVDPARELHIPAIDVQTLLHDYARAALAATPATDPMCERKTQHIMQRDGYRKTGYVLMKDDRAAAVCVTAGAAVAWFSRDQWQWLMYNRDHVAFAWPEPVGARRGAGNDNKEKQ